MQTSSTARRGVKLKDSIAYNLLRVVFAIYFVFAVSITGYHMYLDYLTAEQQIVEQLGLIQQAFQDSLSTALFDLDSAQLWSILKGLHEMQALVGVDLRASNPDIFIPDAAIGTIASPTNDGTLEIDPQGTWIPSQLPYSKLIVHDFVLNQPGTDTEIAQGSFYSSSDVVFATVKSSFVRLVISAIVKTALLWVLFLWAATGRLSRPLRKFADDIAQLDLDSGTSTPIRVPTSRRRDELKVLSDAFHAMQLRMHDYVAALRSEKKAAEDARAEAEEANSAKSQFLSRMSHELRTPLNAIIGFSEVLLYRTADESPDRRRLQYISDAGNDLLRLVNNVMGVVEPNEDSISPEPCGIDEVLGRSIGTVLTDYRFGGVAIDYLARGHQVHADQDRLHRVFVCLLSNAVLHSPDGARVIARSKAVGDGRVRIEIEDAGVGIATEDQEVIFEPFHRLSYTKDNQIPGIGMGLVLAKALTQAMKGRIGIVSERGKGSIFWIELPQVE